MLLSEMRADVRERIGERVENFWLDSFIDRKINDGRKRFAGAEPWEWLFTTQSNVTVTAGVGTIELIDEVAVNRHFNLTLTKSGDNNLYLPTKVTPGKGLELRSRFLTDATPKWWYTTGVITNEYEDGTFDVAQIIQLVPKPDVAFVAEYSFIRRPTILTADDDEDTDIPEDYQDGICAWAAAQCFLKELNQPQKADEQLALYADVLRQAREHHLENAPDELTIVGRDAPEYPDVRRSEWPPRMGSFLDD